MLAVAMWGIFIIAACVCQCGADWALGVGPAQKRAEGGALGPENWDDSAVASEPLGGTHVLCPCLPN